MSFLTHHIRICVRKAHTRQSDVHVYYFQNNEKQMQFAKALWERIRRECKYTYSGCPKMRKPQQWC